MRVSDLLPAFSGAFEWLPILDAVVKTTALLVIAGLASWGLRRASAAARHIVWTLALTSAIVLPGLSLALPRWQLPLVILAAPSPVAPVGRSSDVTAPVRAAPPLSHHASSAGPAPSGVAGASEAERPIAGAASVVDISWPAVLLLVWTLGAAVVLGRLLLGLIAVQWMARRTARVADAPWLPLARRLAADVGVSPRILFLRSDRASMPMAWGVFLPSVLMPSDADTWPVERLRIVLLHELAHVKRRDCLTHVVAQIACALYWFNPLAWVAARRVRAERERACDDLVLAAGTRGTEYADQLLEIARVMRAGRFPALLAGATLAMAHRSQLEGRLMAILDPTVRRSRVSRFHAAAATVVFSCALMPLASMQPWVHAAAPADQRALPQPATRARPDPRPAPDPSPVIDSVRDGLREGIREGIREGVRESVAGGVTGGLAGRVADSVAAIAGPTAQAVVEPTLDLVFDSVALALPDVQAEQKEKVKEATKSKGQERREVDPRTVAALTAALKDTDAEVRETALLALVRLRDPGVFQPLVQALSDPSPDLRERAAFGLGQLKDARGVAPLTKALKDENADVREQAAFALGQLRDRSAVAALTAAMKDADEDVREQAVFALGQMRDPAAIDGLVVALKDSKPDVREQAAFALGQIRDARAVDPLIFALKDAEPDVREQAAFALSQIRDPRAIEALTQALKDENPSVRRQAAFALGQLIR